MSQLTLNAELLTKLPTIKTETTIVDERGKALGFYKPIDYDKLFAEISDEEVDRILKETTVWYTTEELLASFVA
jgi:hypothetical protein